MACWFSNKRRMNEERIILVVLMAQSSTDFKCSYETQLTERATMSAGRWNKGGCYGTYGVLLVHGGWWLVVLGVVGGGTTS